MFLLLRVEGDSRKAQLGFNQGSSIIGSWDMIRTSVVTSPKNTTHGTYTRRAT